MADKGIDVAMLLDEWRALDRVSAVKQDRVHVFGHDYVTIPGPRFVLIVEELARVLHPDVAWEDATGERRL